MNLEIREIASMLAGHGKKEWNISSDVENLIFFNDLSFILKVSFFIFM